MGWIALLGENNEEVGVVGDSVWDIMGIALDEIIKEYENKWDRKPTINEIISIINFVLPDHFDSEVKEV